MISIEPFSFEEFLTAQGKDQLVQFIKEFSFQDHIPEVIHDKLMNIFKEYIIVGGMPAAVASWATKRSLGEVSKIHHTIIKTYHDDFNKYGTRIASERLLEVLTTAPRLLGKKFVYSAINRGVSHTSIKEALHLLCMARVCHKVQGVAANGVPLAAEPLEHYFKIILLDVGLSSAELGLSLSDLDSVNNLDLIHKGGIAEQIVGQLLRTISPLYQEPKLYYWISTDKTSNAEIDYVIQHGRHVIPIEVKAGSTGSLKSLHRFMHLKKYTKAIRINASAPTISKMNLKDTQGNHIHYELSSIPFYLIGEIHRLLN